MAKSSGTQDKEVGARIKARRISQNLSQTQLAETLGFSDPKTISNYESGRVPRGQVLRDLAKALNVTPDWILGQNSDPQMAAEDSPEYGGLNRTHRTMRAMLDELVKSKNAEILNHLKRQLTLLLKLSRRHK